MLPKFATGKSIAMQHLSPSILTTFKSATLLTCALFLGLSTSTVSAQGPESSASVLTIGGEKVNSADFAHIFKKNNRESAITAEALDTYMELFINFKLKVLEARELGMDTAQAFVNELAGYRTQLARPYLTDNQLLESLVQEAYARTQEEVRAHHILIRLPENAGPTDTLHAWNRASAMMERLVSGEEFEALAKSKGGSDDPSARDNGGDLGWFRAFAMLYSFEDAVYKAQIGDVVGPVRTRYGYHVIRLDDRREARGEILAAHIMVKPTNPEEAKAKIHELHLQISEGADFASLARQHSDDQSTKSKGGELPWFGTGRMVEAFEEAAFALVNAGDISVPIQTEVGWHIIQRLDYKPTPKLEESRKDIEKRIQRDSRSELTRRSFIDHLAANYGLELKDDALDKVIDAVAGMDSVWAPIELTKKRDRKKVLLVLDDEKVRVQDFVTAVNQRAARIKIKGRSAEQIVDEAFNGFVDDLLIAEEDVRLEQKHDAFRLLMEEYHDGILLFELTDRKVWSKAVKDSTGLANFWTTHKNEYLWDTRVSARIVHASDEAAAARIRAVIQSDGDVETERREMISVDPLSINIERGSFELGSNEWADLGFSELGGIGITKNWEIDGQIVFVQVREVTEPIGKTLDEVRGKVIADYQDFLETTWVDALRARTPYTIHTDVLHGIQ
jgi:peptidyl-prolyl cis-trans isomerase SurA